MTRAAIFNRDGEPVTVTTLSAFALKTAREQGSVRLAIYEPMRAFVHETNCEPDRPQIVTLRPLNREMTAFECDDEVLALRLVASILAGQTALVADRERAAFGRGAVYGFSLACRREP